ncbi:MAG TPA: hypothetical protein VF334_10455 [Polyangia bacterium]
MRALLFASLIALAGCGDDSTIASGPDLAINPCPGTSCCPGAPCSAVGAGCSAFETACTCGSDLRYQCHGLPPAPDMVHRTD